MSERGMIGKERGRINMAQKTYTPEYKAKIVLEVLQGEGKLGKIAAENGLNPNMVRNWKKALVENASTVFVDPKKESKKAKREEEALKKQNNQMLRKIGQLTLERDFLQDCFRRTGWPIPKFDQEGK